MAEISKTGDKNGLSGRTRYNSFRANDISPRAPRHQCSNTPDIKTNARTSRSRQEVPATSTLCLTHRAGAVWCISEAFSVPHRLLPLRSVESAHSETNVADKDTGPSVAAAAAGYRQRGECQGRAAEEGSRHVVCAALQVSSTRRIVLLKRFGNGHVK